MRMSLRRGTMLAGIAALTLTAAPTAASAAVATPTGLKVQATGTTQVALAWKREEHDSISGLYGYNVYRDGTLQTTLGPDRSSYVDTHAAAGKSYSYTLRAISSTAQVSAPSTAATATTGTTTTAITGCSTTAKPAGRYTLSGSLTNSASAPCLNFASGGTNTVLDCRGNTITQNTAGRPAIAVITSGRMLFINCKIANPSGDGIYFETSAYATVANSTFTTRGGHAINVEGSTQIMVSGNTFNGEGVHLSSTNNSSVAANTMVGPTTGTIVAGVSLRDGDHNSVVGNTINGNSAPGVMNSGVGSDDNVLLWNERNAIVTWNTMSNAYDAGVEGVDVVEDALIADNKIAGAGLTGIGQYWMTAFDGNHVARNTISGSPTLMTFSNASNDTWNHLPTGRTQNSFTNNLIWKNKLVSPVSLHTNEYNYGPWPSSFDFAAKNSSMGFPFTASGNGFIENDFGADRPTPTVTPASMVSIAQDNICKPTQPALEC